MKYAVLVFIAFGILCAGCVSSHRNSRIKNSPYTVRGERYHPMSVREAWGYDEVGLASWYGPDGFFSGGKTTANGEEIGPRSLSAAHKLLPLPCLIEVVNLDNRRRAVLRVNDRGPYVPNRILDVSSRAAEVLGFKERGLARVRVRVLRVGDA